MDSVLTDGLLIFGGLVILLAPLPRSSRYGTWRCRMEAPHVSLLYLRGVVLFFGSNQLIALVAWLLAWVCAMVRQRRAWRIAANIAKLPWSSRRK